MSFHLFMLAKALGILSLTLGSFMVPSLALSLWRGESSAAAAFAASLCILALSGMLLLLCGRSKPIRLHNRDRFLIICLLWISASLLSALPYLLSGAFSSVIDCIFEGFSGITTTGATVLTDIQAMPKSLLLWRAITQWLGGLGVLALLLCLFSESDIGGMRITKWEGVSLISDQHSLRATSAFWSLIGVYLTLSACCVLFLYAGGMSFFDAVCHGGAILSSGGFSTYDENMGYFYHRHVLIYITSFFSLLSALNFYLYLHLLRKRRRLILQDSELKFFIVCICIFALLLFLNLSFSGGMNHMEAIRNSVFLTASAVSTSGLYLTEIDALPALCRFLLFLLILTGGCSGSLSGGMKMARVLVLVRSALQNLKTLQHPNAVLAVRMGRRSLPAETVGQVTAFIAFYGLLLLFGSLLISFDTQDMISALTVSASCLSSAGLGLWDSSTPTYFAAFSGWTKMLLSFLMLAGRLEIYAVFLLFTPDFWRPKQ